MLHRPACVQISASFLCPISEAEIFSERYNNIDITHKVSEDWREDHQTEWRNTDNDGSDKDIGALFNSLQMWQLG